MKCNVQNPRFSFRKTVVFLFQLYSKSWTVGKKDDRNRCFSYFTPTKQSQVPPYQSCQFDIFTCLVFWITELVDFLLPKWVLHYQMSELHGGGSKILCLVTLKARMVQRHISIAVCVACQTSVFPFKTFRVSILTHKGTTCFLGTTYPVSLLYCLLTSCFIVFQQCFRVWKYSAMQFIGADLNKWLIISSDFFARN